VALLTAGAGLLMVSNFRYHSFKVLDCTGACPSWSLVVVMLGFALVVLDPPIVLFLLFLGYAVSGPAFTLVRLRQRAMASRAGRARSDRSRAPAVCR
jgi:CDP-diacylglycerol--serine O-phosphatidyltransferase